MTMREAAFRASQYTQRELRLTGDCGPLAQWRTGDCSATPEHNCKSNTGSYHTEQSNSIAMLSTSSRQVRRSVQRKISDSTVTQVAARNPRGSCLPSDFHFGPAFTQRNGPNTDKDAGPPSDKVREDRTLASVESEHLYSTTHHFRCPVFRTSFSDSSNNTTTTHQQQQESCTATSTSHCTSTKNECHTQAIMTPVLAWRPTLCRSWPRNEPDQSSMP